MPSKTVGKRTLKEARATLTQTQYNHKKAILELGQERQAIQVERIAAIAALTVLSERYGINGWTSEQPLAEIITRITEQLPQPEPHTRPEDLRRPVVPPDERLSPTAIESVGGTYRAICGCGWRSSMTPREHQAVQAAVAHEERLHAR